jgi:small subunit ribosomal protein S4
MTKRVQAKSKICRRLGVNLWGRAKNPIVKHDYPPGEHGTKRRKTSDFGTQLAAKQKLKGYYGNITERQFHRLYQEAARRRGDTAENMIGLLERRLDMVIYRLNFVPTIFAARQFANHGHVMVNGRRVTIPSYTVRQDDVVTLRDKAKGMIVIRHNLDTLDRQTPQWLETGEGGLQVTVRDLPVRAQIDVPVREQLIVELYSK